MVKKLALLTIAWKMFILWLATVSIFLLPFNPAFTPIREYASRLPYLVWTFGNFDSMIYMAIARAGYLTYTNAFFPLYPILMRAIKIITGLPMVVIGQFISVISFFMALVIITRILKLDKLTKITYLLLLIIVLFPTSVFYGAVYNDSLFLLLAVLCIYFGRKKKFFWSSVFGALATLARLNGLTLFFYLLLEYFFDALTPSQLTIMNIKKNLLVKSNFQEIARTNVVSILFIPAAFISYLIYTQVAYGDWFIVFSSMKIWNQNHIVFPLQVVWRYIKILILYPSLGLSYWVAWIEALFVGIYTIIMVWSFNKIRASYWIFFFLSILIPSLTGTFQGMPRYGLHIYPFFLSLALFLSNKGLVWRIVYFAVSILLLFLVTMLYTRGYFIA